MSAVYTPNVIFEDIRCRHGSCRISLPMLFKSLIEQRSLKSTLTAEKLFVLLEHLRRRNNPSLTANCINLRPTWPNYMFQVIYIVINHEKEIADNASFTYKRCVSIRILQHLEN
uniref:Uncharacterized protein n=1 Tax=Spongospora subterranea TaxID=70186 RepID=A0A0H5RD87_9EUKA|eukprot:CRZ11711.1 hypothetical protein [Spongospora subterranea]